MDGRATKVGYLALDKKYTGYETDKNHSANGGIAGADRRTAGNDGVY